MTMTLTLCLTYPDYRLNQVGEDAKHLGLGPYAVLKVTDSKSYEIFFPLDDSDTDIRLRLKTQLNQFFQGEKYDFLDEPPPTATPAQGKRACA